MKKLKKTLLLFAVVLCIAICFFAVEASAATIANEGDGSLLTYEISDGEAEITHCDNYCRNVIIPETIEDNGIKYPVVKISEGAFMGDEYLTNVTIPDSIKTIDDYAFDYCVSLTDINIPDSVSTIGEFAFAECQSLTGINLPDSVSDIGNRAFSGSAVRSITIPAGVKSIGYALFENCMSLTSITVDENNSVYDSRDNCNAVIETSANKLVAACKDTIIPDSVTCIGEKAFLFCTYLTDITIPDSITSIENSAFYNCSNLTSVTISNSVENIGEDAFCDNPGLTTVTIGDGVTNIGNGAFYNCPSLTTVNYYCTRTDFSNVNFEDYNPEIITDTGRWTMIHTPAAAVKENETVATCTKEGSCGIVIYCSGCNAELCRSTMTTDKVPHTPAAAVRENVVAATCTKEGSFDSVVYCSVCKAEISRTAMTVDKLGHSFTGCVYNNNATCTADGTMTAKCSRCSETTIITAAGTAKGHVDANGDGICDTCSEKLNSGSSDSSDSPDTGCHWCYMKENASNAFLKTIYKFIDTIYHLFH